MAKYDEFLSPKHEGRPVLVEAARRDGSGKNIENNYAKQNGYYQGMTVGVADQLSPYDESSGDDQDEPFILQGTGTANGTQLDFATGAIALMKEKRGNTVVVNQLFRIDYDTPDFPYTYTNGVFSYNGTPTGDKYIINSPIIISGHKYLVVGYTNSSFDGFYTYIAENCGFGSYNININGTKIVTATSSYSGTGTYNFRAKADVSYSVSFVPLFIDLTQWFNGDIPADLLAHPDHFFRYYQGSLAYNTGELVNANGRYIKCIGMNQWDEEWELGGISNGIPYASTTSIRGKNYCKAISNTQYTCSTNFGGVVWYDKDKNYISTTYSNNLPMTSPVNAAYFKLSFSSNYGTTYNNDISINLYYEDEPRCLTYEPYQVLTNNDTGNEVLRSAGNVKDSKAPDGTITRRVGNRAYQSGDENDSSLITDGTTTNYPLAEPTTEQGTPYSENLVIDDFGSMDFGSDVPQGALIFYPVDYKAFIDTLYKYTDGTPSNIALKSDLASDKTELQGVDTQLQNAVGGTLRQCLCVKESLDFDNTAFVDLGTLNWNYSSLNGVPAFTSGVALAGLGTNKKSICSKYSSQDGYQATNKTYTLMRGADGTIWIIDNSYTDATTFKNAMKGVLLAYEKAE